MDQGTTFESLNRSRRADPFGTGLSTVELRMASPDAVFICHGMQPGIVRTITAIADERPGPVQGCGS
jgi:hypothetical protein